MSTLIRPVWALGLALSLAAGPGPAATAAPTSTDSPASSSVAVSAPAAASPVYDRFALRGMAVERRAVRVRLVEKPSGEAVRGATVRFRATGVDGRKVFRARPTNARGVARWVLPRVSSRYRYVDATYRPRTSDTTYVRTGLCKQQGGRWTGCGAG